MNTETNLEIELSCKEITLYVGQTYPITVTIFSEDVRDMSFIWNSSDNKIAIMDTLEDGSKIIRAIGFGECVITFTTADGRVSESCHVVVESTFMKKKREDATYDYHFEKRTELSDVEIAKKCIKKVKENEKVKKLIEEFFPGFKKYILNYSEEIEK